MRGVNLCLRQILEAVGKVAITSNDAATKFALITCTADDAEYSGRVRERSQTERQFAPAVAAFRPHLAHVTRRRRSQTLGAMVLT